MTDLDPLYKILCLALIFLVPLAPAYCLFKIAPSDRFLAKGTFAGFKINATGSAAIYIVLFAAIYTKTGIILQGIDQTIKLEDRIDSLQHNQPWKLQYRLTLMDDSTHEISQNDYARYVQPDSIVCFPRAMQFNTDSKIITFYIDNELMTNMGDSIKSQLLLRNSYGTRQLVITKNLENQQDHIINIKGVFYKAKPKASQIDDINNHHAPVLNKSPQNTAPPPVSANNLISKR
jgi:hypothetical protein